MPNDGWPFGDCASGVEPTDEHVAKFSLCCVRAQLDQTGAVIFAVSKHFTHRLVATAGLSSRHLRLQYMNSITVAKDTGRGNAGTVKGREHHGGGHTVHRCT